MKKPFAAAALFVSLFAVATFAFSMTRTNVVPVIGSLQDMFLVDSEPLISSRDTGLTQDQLAPAATVAWSMTTGASAWYTNTNWSPNTSAAQWLFDDVARFNNTGTANTAGINMGTAQLSIGAVEVTNLRTRILTIGNSSMTVGTLTLNGTSVNSIPNTILRNASSSLLTLQNNDTGTGKTMNVSLGNATENVVSVDGAGGITISSVITGPGRHLTLRSPFTDGSVPFTLSGINTFSGETRIRGGMLSLITNGSIAQSSAIDIANGGWFDVQSLTTPFVLSNGQVLRASGAGLTGRIATSSTRGLTTAANSPIEFVAFNGATPPLTISGAGTIALQTGNSVTVTVSNGGTPLAALDYKLIAKGTAPSAVTGIPSSLTVNGDGVNGVPSLVLINGELYLRVTADTTPPTAPVITSSDPTSPGNDLTPNLIGTAEAGSTVRIYKSTNCTGTVVVGTAADFLSPGLTVAADSLATTSFTATATDAANNVSACSAPPFQYTHTAGGEPTVQASNVTFNQTANSVTVNWTNGNGAQRVVFAKQGSAITSHPVDGTSYTANSAFGLGTPSIDAAFPVFSGTGSSVAVTGLTPGQTYHFAVYEYNGAGATTDYLTPGAAGSVTKSIVHYRSTANGTWNFVGIWEVSLDGTPLSWVPAVATPSSADGPITILHNVSVGDGRSVDQLTVAPAGTLTVESGGVQIVNGLGDDLANNGAIQLSSGGTLNISASQFVNSGTFQAESGTTLRVQAATLTNNTAINIAGGNLVVYSNSLINGAGTYSYDSDGTLEFQVVSGTLPVNDVAYWPVTNGPGRLRVFGPGNISVAAARTVADLDLFTGLSNAGNLTITDIGTIFTGGFFSGSPNWDPLSTLRYETGGTYGRAGEWLPNATSGPGYPHHVTIGGNTSLDLGNGSTTQPFQLAGDLTVELNSSFSMAGASPMTAPLRVLGSFLSDGNVTLSSVSGGDLFVGLDWYSEGTFTNNGRRVTFNGSGDQFFVSSSTFFDLDVVGSTPRTVVFFEGTTQTVTNSLTMTGTAGNLLTLSSFTPLAQWNISAPATQSVSFVNVRDSNNSGSIITATNSVNSGNNVGWNFIAANQPPVINSTAPTTATEDVAYLYDANVTDPDGPGATWSLLGTHTCGGTINPSTGEFTFTPAGPVPPASCVVAIQVADGGTPNLTATQSTTVNITAVNDAPVINSTAPTTATEETLYTYNATRIDADGPGATWSLLGTHTCGGTIVAGTGVFTFTPAGPVPPASCVVAIQVADGGTPNLAATQTTTVNITAVNDAPVINSVAPTTATEDTLYTYNATRIDADGPGATWSLLGTHTCGGSIVAGTGVFTFTPAGPVPPASCVVAIQVADGGSPNLNATQSTTVNIAAVNDPPIAVDDVGTTPQDVPFVVTGASLAGNDVDPDGPSLTVISVSNPTNGSVILSAGTVTFTPTAGFFGTAGFDYTVSDGTFTDVGHVTITVTQVVGPATLEVDTLVDNVALNGCTAAPNDCSLRGANSVAVAGDTITFDEGVFLRNATTSAEAPMASLTLASELVISSNVTINGPGVSNLTINGGGVGGNRIFSVASGTTVAINNMELTGGGSVGALDSGDGGAINTRGNLTVDRVYVRDNSASACGGGIKVSTGGTLTVTNSTFSAQTAVSGGAVCGAGGAVTIRNSTISGNTATNGGGVAATLTGSGLTVSNSTISGNTGSLQAGGIFVPTTLNMTSTILSGNTSPSGPDLFRAPSGTFTSSGYNLIGDSPGDSTNTGSSVSYQPTDIVDQPHGLNTLGNNGGPTPTMLPLFGFAGHDKGCALGLATDQRGFSRTTDSALFANAACAVPTENGTDIGAVELVAPTAAPASIGGRVITAGGRGITNVSVTVRDMNGRVVGTALSSSFGYFSFESLPTGASYIVTVRSKRYLFSNPSRLISLSDNIDSVDFVAEP